MKLLMWFAVGLNIFSASLGLFGANDNWSINLVTAIAIYVIYKGT
jgi:low affinity Fe/Cu permease